MAVEIDLPLGENAGAGAGLGADSDAHAARLAAELTELGNERFLRAALPGTARFHHRSTDRLIGWPPTSEEAGEPASSLLLRAIHLCFTAHLPPATVSGSAPGSVMPWWN
ncbi:hypothetical protein OH786_01345 [Streptomyces atratus]|uniref:hypothetical protein n=1 Tax=Streptomyces atratus TaxID=1893 RepID=UPI00324D0F86